MFRFFRQIRQSLLSQNKVSRYLLYAVGEIVLVVIGILLALQIDTWNQERINAREERRIFQDLMEELKYNDFLVENGMKTMAEVITAAEGLLVQVNEPSTPFREEFFNEEIDKLTRVWVSGRPTTLYDVLSGSGDFNLISSPVLRKKLADLKRNQETLIKFEDMQNRYVDDQLRPFLNRHMDRTTIRSGHSASVLITSRHSSVFPANDKALIENREFANLLTDLIFFTERIMENYKRVEQDIAEIDSLLFDKYPDLKPKVFIPY
jgi:hypothetical protein